MPDPIQRAEWLRHIHEIRTNSELASITHSEALVRAIHDGCANAPASFSPYFSRLPSIECVDRFCSAGAVDQAAMAIAASLFGWMISQAHGGEAIATVSGPIPFEESTSEGPSVAIALVGAIAGSIYEAFPAGRPLTNPEAPSIPH